MFYLLLQSQYQMYILHVKGIQIFQVFVEGILANGR